VQAKIQTRGQPEEARRQRTIEADADLEKTIRSDRIRKASRAPAEDIAAEPQAPHESGQHRRDCVDGVPENEPQHAQPDDFVDERGRARDEEAGDEDASGGTLGRRRGRPPRAISRAS
jgi:hypothetical protein